MATSLIAAVGLGLSAFGTVKSREANKRVSEESQRAEALRKQAADLENQRQIRETIRKAQAARASAIATAAVSGTLDSSVTDGAIGQITGQAGASLVAQAENANLQGQIFDSNARISEARGDAAEAGAYTDFGRNLFNNAAAIGKIGNTVLNSNATPWNTEVRSA